MLDAHSLLHVSRLVVIVFWWLKLKTMIRYLFSLSSSCYYLAFTARVSFRVYFSYCFQFFMSIFPIFCSLRHTELGDGNLTFSTTSPNPAIITFVSFAVSVHTSGILNRQSRAERQNTFDWLHILPVRVTISQYKSYSANGSHILPI